LRELLQQLELSREVNLQLSEKHTKAVALAELLQRSLAQKDAEVEAASAVCEDLEKQLADAQKQRIDELEALRLEAEEKIGEWIQYYETVMEQRLKGAAEEADERVRTLEARLAKHAATGSVTGTAVAPTAAGAAVTAEGAATATDAPPAGFVRLSDMESAILLAVEKTREQLQKDTDRVRSEAVRAAMASAANDFKVQLTSAMTTVRDALEAEKAREIEASVATARAEYEAVMRQWERATEAWRKDTVSACERSLEAARLQVSDAKARWTKTEALIKEKEEEIARLRRVLLSQAQVHAHDAAASAAAPGADSARTPPKQRTVPASPSPTRSPASSPSKSPTTPVTRVTGVPPSVASPIAFASQRNMKAAMQFARAQGMSSRAKDDEDDEQEDYSSDSESESDDSSDSEQEQVKKEKTPSPVPSKKESTEKAEPKPTASFGPSPRSSASTSAASVKLGGTRRSQLEKQLQEAADAATATATAAAATAAAAIAAAHRDASVNVESSTRKALHQAARAAAANSEAAAAVHQKQAEQVKNTSSPSPGKRTPAAGPASKDTPSTPPPAATKEPASMFARAAMSSGASTAPPETAEATQQQSKHSRTSEQTSGSTSSTANVGATQSPQRTRPTSAATASATSAGAEKTSEEQEHEQVVEAIRGMTVVALRAMLQRMGVSFADCVEKKELQDRLLAALVRGQGLATSTGRTGLAESAATSAARASAASPQHRHASSAASSPGKPTQSKIASPAATPAPAPGGAHAKPPSPAELKNWLPAKAPDGSTYYYHRITRAVRWDRPDSEAAKRIEERIQEERASVRMRQEERLAELASARDAAKKEAEARSRIESTLDGRLKAWAKGKSARGMLMSLATGLIAIPKEIPEDISTLAATGTVDNIKKAYLKAVRVVHPDKMGSAPLEAQLEAQKAFALLSEAYKKFTENPTAALAEEQQYQWQQQYQQQYQPQQHFSQWTSFRPAGTSAGGSFYGSSFASGTGAGVPYTPFSQAPASGGVRSTRNSASFAAGNAAAASSFAFGAGAAADPFAAAAQASGAAAGGRPQSMPARANPGANNAFRTHL
jgi:hypothetical protein